MRDTYNVCNARLSLKPEKTSGASFDNDAIAILATGMFTPFATPSPSDSSNGAPLQPFSTRYERFHISRYPGRRESYPPAL